MPHTIFSNSLPVIDEGVKRMEGEFHKILAGVGVSSLPDIRLTSVGKHLVFTDGDTVLIKMSRPGQNDRRLFTENAVGSTGISVIRRSLFREVLETQGRKFIVSEYVHGTPVKAVSAAPEVGRLLAQSLVEIHSAPVTASVRTALNSLLELPHQVKHRIIIHQGLSDVSRQGLTELVRVNLDSLYSETRDVPRTLTHGDAHARNFILADSQTSGQWIDLEKSKYAPVEWDVASLRHSLLHKGKNPAAWSAAEEVFKENYPSLDESLVDRFGDAIYLIRGISDIWNERVEYAEEHAQAILGMVSG